MGDVINGVEEEGRREEKTSNAGCLLKLLRVMMANWPDRLWKGAG